MVKISLLYKGDLEVVSTHGPSGVKLSTDAPIDNQGKGRSFSPSDLVATALGSCMATIMGIVAGKHGIDLTGMTIQVEKEMTSQPTRRIGSLKVDFNIPSKVAEKDQKLLERAAYTCPVHQSLHPDIRIEAKFNWA